MTEFEKFKKKNFPPETPDWLIKLVKQAFDCGVKTGQKMGKKWAKNPTKNLPKPY